VLGVDEVARGVRLPAFTKIGTSCSWMVKSTATCSAVSRAGTLSQFWQKRHQLPDSLPDFLEHLERRLPTEFHEQARLTLLNETSGWFATHPTDARRIQKARQQTVEGIFDMEKPARWLLNDFVGTSRVVTGRHYRQNLRLAATDRMLKPVSDFFSDNDRHPPQQTSPN
jgi:hypothetical protein